MPTTKDTTGPETSNWADRIRNSQPGTAPWYQAYRDREYEQSKARAKSVQREELRQQDVLPDEDRNSGASESQVGCNNVVVPPGAPSADRGNDDA